MATHRTTAQLAAVKTLVPSFPPTFYAIGLNYAAHATQFAALQGLKIRHARNRGTARIARSSRTARTSSFPAESDGIQYEGELVAVIGKTARHVAEADALSIVLGYTIGNDVSERAWQKIDIGLWRAKNCDTFKPMGPWIETDVDLPSLMTRVRINGEQRLEFRTNEMIFGLEQHIAEITKYITLHPGDVIWMGTEGSNADLKAGDVCEIELDQIGTLSNPVVAERR